MSLIVMKFGGSSVADTERVQNVARRVTDSYKEGNSVVVVVSAQGDTTDDFIEKAAALNKNPSKREMDVLLSAGEQISMSLLAMAIENLGFPVVSLTGWQAGIETDSKYSSARIHRVKSERISNEIDKKNIVIVAGFQGINKYDDITTLGRGGSDTTAVALAVALHADICEIYTDVDGVYTADPRIVKNAQKLNDISYDEMLELASLGANVLHNRSVELALKYNMPLAVKTSFERVEGTIVKEVNKVEKMLVRGVTRDNDVARISVQGLDDTPGKAFQIFSMLAKHGVNVDVILQSAGSDNTNSISFTVTKANAQLAGEKIKENLDRFGAKSVEVDESVSKVSIVGAGMSSNAGVAAKMFEALYDKNINIQMISTSEIKVSVIIAEEDAERAVVAVHDKFDLGR